MPRSRRALIIAGLVALALHIFLYGVLDQRLPRLSPPPTRPKPSRPVTVRIAPAPESQRPPSQRPEVKRPELAAATPSPAPKSLPPRRSPRGTKAKTLVDPSAKVAASAAASPTNHGGWLPGAAWGEPGVTSTDDAASATWTSPPARVQATQPFTGKLDIPLLARMDKGSAKAVASLRREGDGKIHLAYLDGQPLLRAVLFEALVAPQNRAVLNAMFDGAGLELFVSLRLTTIKVAMPPSHEEEKLLFFEHRIVIERTMFHFESPAPAVSLPDAEAERAKRRDRAHLQRLMTSPAYISPLRHRALP